MDTPGSGVASGYRSRPPGNIDRPLHARRAYSRLRP